MKEGLPDLREIPSVVGGDPKQRTGIVVAKSIPAKKYGIQTGEPMAMALRKCPNLVVVPSDFRLYTENSLAFKAICRDYAPVVESFSIDEVFLDMTGTSLIYPDPIATAHQIKDTIHEELGFTVNVGISTNKLLAKMASDFEKPDKVHTLFPAEIPEKMWPLPIRDLLFLGKASEKKTAGFRNPYHRGACQGEGIHHPGFAWRKDGAPALPVCQRNRQFPGACPGRREQGLQRGENLQ